MTPSEGARRSGDEPVTRSTVDLPRSVNRALRRFALDNDTTLQAVLRALAEAVVAGDEAVLEALRRRIPDCDTH